ncbi:5'-nucleotidase domain-containing protein [Anaeramoeba ignava]|uniref:5'-nucleotidase domain-containing protein n=1 Tax=Anaeramoeba ignava TaxID=1746090 RepID=A0A9Q0LQQ1_ANAIG|nr:5'-nucleotidase domain-containing protein [Anaeramoeba ignava]
MDYSRDSFFNSFQKIDFVGFDLDHTLIHYKIQELGKLVFDCLKRYVVEIRSFNKDLLQVEYDPEICVKGNLCDISKGNLIKIDNDNKVRRAFHGVNKQLSLTEIEQQYNQDKIIEFSGHRTENFLPVFSYFELGMGSLFIVMVDFFDEKKDQTCKNYAEIAKLVLDAMDYIFNDWNRGYYYPTITNNLDKYIKKSPKIRKLLEKMKENGKGLFLITNSLPEYSNYLLSFSIGSDWEKLFQIVVFFARKPSFYDSKAQFEIISQNEKSMKLMFGNYNEFKKLLFNSTPNKKEFKTCYFGDHLIGDIKECKAKTDWNTVAIIEELKPNSNDLLESPKWGSFSFCDSSKETKEEKKKTFWQQFADTHSDYYVYSLEEFYDQYCEFLSKK